jgi:hypothetical protein
VKAVRGTILFLNWSWLKTHGYYERYTGRVDPEYRTALSTATTSDWIEVDVFRAHYRALDSLDISNDEAIALGRSVGKRAYGAFLSTLVRLAGSLGATPWFALGQAQRIWERSYRGGGVRVARTGHNAASIQIVGNSMATSAFHRGAFIGAFAVGLESFCKNLRVTEVPSARTPASFALAAEWR